MEHQYETTSELPPKASTRNKGRPLSQKYLDLHDIVKEHKGEWVVLAEGPTTWAHFRRYDQFVAHVRNGKCYVTFVGETDED